MVHPYPSYNSIGMIKEINGYNVDMEFLFKDSTSKDESFRVCPLNGRFLVSNMARCYDMKKEKFLNDYSNNSNKTPYKTWFLCSYEDDSKTKKNNSYPIHRVVAETWCDKLDTNERLVVDHIDGDKHNNLASNLRWITYKENSNAQDVQERKAQTLKKNNQHKRELQALTSIIAEKDNEIKWLRDLTSWLVPSLCAIGKYSLIEGTKCEIEKETIIGMLDGVLLCKKDEIENLKKLYNTSTMKKYSYGMN